MSPPPPPASPPRPPALPPPCSVNVQLGPREERLLITGLHAVADIQCNCCGSVLGWKYVRTPALPRALAQPRARAPGLLSFLRAGAAAAPAYVYPPPRLHSAAKNSAAAHRASAPPFPPPLCGAHTKCAQEQAYEESQKYKEGKYIVEKARVVKISGSGGDGDDC